MASSNSSQTDQQSSGKGAISKNAIIGQSTAARPEDLGVTPWYFEDYPPADSSPGPTGDRSSYPSCSYADKEMAGKLDLTSTRNSSIDSEIPRPVFANAAPRKAYMDLRDAIALLDETCPNQELSPSLTPRTPLTPYPRNKRARSKSSDNSSNYSNDRLSDRSFETARPPDKEKKRPFLKKIGISKTEDKPFLATLAPKIIGKPYLEKIGPSRALERPFLEKIGSSKTLDKFNFETPRYERKNVKADNKSVLKEETARSEQVLPKREKEKPAKFLTSAKKFATERRRSGKGLLLKMYSFETEDLESTVQSKDHRDPLRGASLDDVLDSGPSSLPSQNETDDQLTKPDPEEPTTSGAELLKCRVTTSEEIIFFNSSLGSPREPTSWGNSPRKIWRLKKENATQRTPTHHGNSREGLRSDESTPNSPTKRPISKVSPDRQTVSQTGTLERNIYSPTKTRRQTSEDVLDRKAKDKEVGKESKQAQFEKRGISSDNLLSKDNRSLTIFGYRAKDHVEETREACSEDSLARRGVQEYSKETFKQLQDKFKFHEIPTETYADFKRRTRANLQSPLARQHERLRMSVATLDSRHEIWKDSTSALEEGKTIGSIRTTKSEEESSSGGNVASEVVRGQGGTVRSVLRKQEGIDHPADYESDPSGSTRRPKRRIFHEPSQETMDLLTELRKVKSLLKTPSWEKDLELDKKAVRLPKRILLTDKEFCLSVERENSIRRPSKVVSSLETTEEGASPLNKAKEDAQGKSGELQPEKTEVKIPGPALFEKKCLSLDYADDEKPQKPEARAISLASARNLPEVADYEFAFICDSKSYSSDVFNSPSEETNEKERVEELEKDSGPKVGRNHCAEVDIAIPIDQKASPKDGVDVHGRTSDLYEIISPRSTPFRVKKRLGKISVEETVKPESFTLGSKVDCRSVVKQKRTTCFPL